MRQIKEVIFIAGFGLLCGGCSVLHHMDQLMVMGDYARDKNVQYKMVDENNAHYDALVAALNSGKIKNYPNQVSIRTAFGEPIAKQIVTVDGESRAQWLYRYAIPQKAKDKVYLYFNNQGQLITHTQEKIQWL